MFDAITGRKQRKGLEDAGAALAKRVEALERRATTLAGIEQRVQALMETTSVPSERPNS